MSELGRYVAVHPTQPQILGGPYLWDGFPAGCGVWATTDAGATWTSAHTGQVWSGVRWVPPESATAMTEDDAVAAAYSWPEPIVIISDPPPDPVVP